MPTVRIGTPDPRDAKRHILIESEWDHSHITACLIDLPKKYCKTGSAPVDDVECPRCRETPEFGKAVEDAQSRDTVPNTTVDTPQTTPRTTQPETLAQPTKKRAQNNTDDQSTTDSQGSLF